MKSFFKFRTIKESSTKLIYLSQIVIFSPIGFESFSFNKGIHEIKLKNLCHWNKIQWKIVSCKHG